MSSIDIESSELRERIGTYSYWVDLTSLFLGDTVTRHVISPRLARKYNVSDHIGFVTTGRHKDDCVAHAFGRILKEPWVFEPAWLDAPLESDIQEFLPEIGFKPADNPKPGNLVVYGWRNGDSLLHSAAHFGVIRADYWVESKLGTGAVFRHKTEAVLWQYGDTAEFFEKVKQG